MDIKKVIFEKISMSFDDFSSLCIHSRIGECGAEDTEYFQDCLAASFSQGKEIALEELIKRLQSFFSDLDKRRIKRESLSG